MLGIERNEQYDCSGFARLRLNRKHVWRRPLLRMLAVEAVEEAGYVALEAGDADEAIALLESRPHIALLFTDIDMPGSMDGLKLAHAVRDRWPPVKILVASGKVRLQPS